MNYQGISRALPALCFLFFFPLLPLAAQDIPPWVISDWEYLTGGTGTWIASNAEYQSEQEPYESYGIRWEWGIGKKSIRGELYAIRNGKRTGAIWEFLTYWHPGEQKCVHMQLGSDGTYGVGWTTKADERLAQTFYSVDGSSYTAGHESNRLPIIQVTTSYSIDANQQWTKNRSYVWKLQE